MTAKKRLKATHKLIKATAEEIAGQSYDELAAANKTFRDIYPDQYKFVERNWQEFVLAARAALALMLMSPTVSEVVKDDIHEALLLDRTLNYKGSAVMAG